MVKLYLRRESSIVLEVLLFKLCGELLCELSGTSPRIGGAVSGLPDDQILASCFHDIH